MNHGYFFLLTDDTQCTSVCRNMCKNNDDEKIDDTETQFKTLTHFQPMFHFYTFLSFQGG